ncbi:glutamate receptor ionotropic, kainate 5-like [Hyalella azteca]|uniref:Glutamate receptor ionotropic, kainate 5-like n=1 Tax=Hyalella azteca TaxID=294128 RepID=A0A8B7P7D2_HYAAZ|nr:glutamate receptor ionotropic, kainate 5-like [Hyalella azteca]
MASELNLSNVGGVFVVLLGGMGLALVVAIFEFLGECINISKDDEIPFVKVLRQELRFIFKCKGSTKPIRKKASEAGDDIDDDDDEHEETIYGGSDVYSYGNKTPIT